MQAYLTSSTISFGIKVGAVIDEMISDSMEHYTGKPEQTAEYERQMRHLFGHVLHCSILHGDRTIADRPTYVPVPLSNPGLTRKWPLAILRKSRLKQRRGLDALRMANVMDLRFHDYKRHKCTLLSLDTQVFSKIRGAMLTERNTRCLDDYLDNVRGYRIERLARGQRTTTIREDISRAVSTGAQLPKHDLREITGSRGSRQLKSVVERFRHVLDELEPVTVDLEGLLNIIFEQYLGIKTDSDAQRVLQLEYALYTILDRGVTPINSDGRTLYKYWPEYKVATTGGRLFEQRGGVQNLPAEVKSKILIGNNFDIKSSQLNILRQELSARGIRSTSLDKYSGIETVQETLDIDRKLAKVVFYATVFSGGIISNSPYSSIWSALCVAHGPEIATQKMDRWIKVSRGLCRSLRKLGAMYIAEANKTRHGTTLTNAVGLRLTLSDTKAGSIRKALAHMIQGIEADYLHQVVMANPGTISALEHDGWISSAVTPKLELSNSNLSHELKWANTTTTTTTTTKAKAITTTTTTTTNTTTTTKAKAITITVRTYKMVKRLLKIVKVGEIVKEVQVGEQVGEQVGATINLSQVQPTKPTNIAPDPHSIRSIAINTVNRAKQWVKRLPPKNCFTLDRPQTKGLDPELEALYATIETPKKSKRCKYTESTAQKGTQPKASAGTRGTTHSKLEEYKHAVRGLFDYFRPQHALFRQNANTRSRKLQDSRTRRPIDRTISLYAC